MLMKIIKKEIQRFVFKSTRKFIRNFDNTYLRELNFEYNLSLVKDFKNVQVGNYTYISTIEPIADGSIIGKYCAIAPFVSIGTGKHPINYLSIHPFQYSKDFIISNNSQKVKFKNSEPIIIGNDVWIGKNAIIMDGVTIGDGAIIGAGAIVTKNIPPYAIAVGIPARVIKYRFSEEIIKELLELKWWNMPEETIANLPFADIEQCIKELKKIIQNNGNKND